MKSCFVLFAVALFALPAFGYSACGFSCGPGHIFLENTSYPFIEDITLGTQTVNGTWKSLHQTTCANAGGGDLNGNVTTNVVIRGYMKVSAVSGVGTGARWEMKLTVDGVEIAGSTRSFKQDRLTGSFLLPVSETIAATAQSVSAGRHVVELWAHMVDAGQFDVQDVYIQAQGVPASYSTDHVTASSEITIPTSTTQLTSNVQIANGTGANIDIIPQAQYQLTGGTPGTPLTLWFRLTQVGGGSGITNGPTMQMYVPCEILTGGTCSAPSGPRDGATILGEYMSVPPGTWNLALFGYSATAAMTPTIAWRYVEYASVPAPILYSGPTYENAIQTVRNTSPLTVSTSASGEQPITWGGGCPFTKVLETTMPTSKANDDENWNGVLYIDFWRDGSPSWGNWSNAGISVVLEATTWDPFQNQYVTAEFGSYHTSLPPDGYGFYIFTSALLWGNYPQGNVVKVFVRKDDCANSASFQARTRSLTLKRLPADASCYVIQ